MIVVIFVEVTVVQAHEVGSVLFFYVSTGIYYSQQGGFLTWRFSTSSWAEVKI